MVKKFALPSVCSSTFSNWEIRLIDDSTSQNANDVVQSFLTCNPKYKKFANNIIIHPTNDTLENKLARETPNTEGGSIFGKFAQEAIMESSADICFMLCDDDAIYPDYTLNLSLFYKKNPDKNYSYCHVTLYSPVVDILSEAQYRDCKLNNTECLRPPGRLDSSQVSWRIKPFIDDEIYFPYPRTRSIDRLIYRQMFNKWGDCCWNGLCGQYKARFKDQLGNRGNKSQSRNWYTVKDI